MSRINLIGGGDQREVSYFLVWHRSKIFQQFEVPRAGSRLFPSLLQTAQWFPLANLESLHLNKCSRSLDMVKNALSNGFSSQVRGWLVVGGVQHQLAQVGPDFCILREPIGSKFFDTSDIQADLVIEVDGNPREVAVLLTSNHSSYPIKLHFRTIQVA